MGRKYRIQRCGFADNPFDQLPLPNKLAMTERLSIKYDASVRLRRAPGTMAAHIADPSSNYNSCHFSARLKQLISSVTTQ